MEIGKTINAGKLLYLNAKLKKKQLVRKRLN